MNDEKYFSKEARLILPGSRGSYSHGSRAGEDGTLEMYLCQIYSSKRRVSRTMLHLPGALTEMLEGWQRCEAETGSLVQ